MHQQVMFSNRLRHVTGKHENIIPKYLTNICQKFYMVIQRTNMTRVDCFSGQSEDQKTDLCSQVDHYAFCYNVIFY